MGEAESQQSWQGRHFCKGKRDWFEGIQFLKVAVDNITVLTVSNEFVVKSASLHRSRRNGFFTGKDSLEDTVKIKHFKALLGIRSVWTEVLFWLWKLCGKRRGSYPGPLICYSDPPEWT